MPPPWPTRPCGTPAAAKRHQRRGEKPCDDCRAAQRAETADRKGWEAGAKTPDTRELRNGLQIVPYQWRARRYTWAVRVLARAEAAWGRPEDEEAA